MLPITWKKETSNHAKLRLASKVRELAKMTGGNITCHDPSNGVLHYFLHQKEGLFETSLPEGVPDRITLPDGTEEVTVTIDTMYRDAYNYKFGGTEIFQGVIDLSSVDIVLTALWMDLDGFIPHQILMTDQQLASGYSLDFEDQDHPWHSALSFRIKTADKTQGEKHTSFEDLLRAAEDRLSEGWDEISAVAYLIENSPK
jgi:hypothetical protein